MTNQTDSFGNAYYPLELNLTQLAGFILDLHDKSPVLAAKAYAGCLLIPGVEQLRFETLLKEVKRDWNSSLPKYTAFFDAKEVVQKMVRQKSPRTWVEVRGRLIMSMRLFMLFRSIDLERTLRTVSVLGSRTWILSRRKGWRQHRWVELVRLNNNPNMSPYHLFVKYIQITRSICSTRTRVPLFWSVVQPFHPISTKTIASITRNMLKTFNVDVTIWDSHSTRGAAVSMLIDLGLTPEEVAEVGDWSSFEAFRKHYLRIQGARKAQDRLSQLVHKDPRDTCPRNEPSRTPGRFPGKGGSEGERRGQEGLGPPTHPNNAFSFVDFYLEASRKLTEEDIVL